MRALVTGANGLIGAQLVRELLRRGVEVRAMTLVGGRRDAIDGLPVELVPGDVRDPPETFARLCAGCDLIFHTASYFRYSGIDGDALDHTAQQGTRNVLSGASQAGVRRVVVTSSSVVFGSSMRPRARDEHSRSDSGFDEPAYVRSKVRQHQLVKELAPKLGLDAVLVCPTMTIGPHPGKVGPSNGAILAYLQDPFRLTYPGGCNFVSARDVANGHWLAATRADPGDDLLLGSENLTWHEVHERVARLCGVEPPRYEIGYAAAYLAATMVEIVAHFRGASPLSTRDQARMIGRYYWYDDAKARSLGYAPRPAGTALAATCAWLASSPHVSSALRRTLTLSAEAYEARRAPISEEFRE